MSAEINYRIGVDVGGTFTDIVLVGEDGNLFVRKLSSTPDRYDDAIIDGIRSILNEAGVLAVQVKEVCHSTTAATNAVLERKGARVGLITTSGFRDVLELRRLRVPTLYDLFYVPPEPLVPRYLRFEIEERVTAQGRILKRVDFKELAGIVNDLVSEEVDSVAICLINSFTNPENEKLIGKFIAENFPKLFVTLSTDVMPAIREFERTSTTVANAYLMPFMHGYILSLRKRLSGMGIKAPISVMQSSGGMITSQMAAVKPIFALESGPVAGVAGATYLSRKMDLPRLLTFDMGGTTTKAAVIEDGNPHKSGEYEIGAPISRSSRLVKGGGYLLMVRTVDVAEVGAGGGSIVSLDKGGSFQVGPKSSGAVPGPICYDRGGQEPTTSDANILLGYLNPEFLLGGALKVNLEDTRRIFEAKVSNPLQLGLHEAAFGVHQVANASMARAMRSVTTERGRDVRNFTMVAFGGSGPCHAASLASLLGMRRIIIPASPGLFSSLGLLAADQEHEFVRSLMMSRGISSVEELEDQFVLLEQQSIKTFQNEGYDVSNIGFTRYADVHYVGQIHELTITIPDLTLFSEINELFEKEHERTYGYRSINEKIELVNIRVIGRQITPTVRQTDLTTIGSSLYDYVQNKSDRKAYFGQELGLIEVPVISRYDVDLQYQAGPAIIEEYDTTIVVPPDWSVRRDSHWNLILGLEN
jgi:N-methylhydantoinase A